MIKNWFNRLDKRSALKRLPFAIFSIVCCSFGIACYYACGLGADPLSIFVDGQHNLLHLTYGQVTSLDNIILLAFMIFIAREYLHIGTLISCFATGPLIDLFEGFLRSTFPTDTTALWIKILILCVGVVSMAFGAGLFFTVNMGVGPFDYIPLKLRDKTRFSLRWIKVVYDAIFVTVGWLMGGVVGVGTIAGVLLTGPIIAFFMKRLSPPLDRFFGPLYKT
jgi:uncharacterized membrane protein YczE